MKYAFIVMLAVYLVTFGCNPKSEEEHTSPEEKTEHASVEKAPTAPAPPENVHVAAKAAVPAPPAQVTLETKIAAEAKPDAEHKVLEVAKADQKAEPKADDTGSNQWKAIAQSAATTVLALMNEDTEKAAKESAAIAPAAKTEEKAVAETVEKAAPAAEKTEVAQQGEIVLPCGMKMAKNAANNLPPCAKPGTPCPKTGKVAPCVKPGQPCPKAGAVLPCGKQMPKDAAGQPPCMRHAPVAKQPAAPAVETELSEAMQKMVNATNDMVAITRQLVIATQQMLAASKDVAVEVIDSGKDALEASKPAVENAVNEQEIIETVKEVVSATKEAFEATSEALSNAIEAKEAAPAPEAAAQQ